jgi:DNA-binding CsgD family transcriptional regulator
MPREDVSLVERDAELAVIAGRLAAAGEGAGCLLMVEGPAGIGKTQLVRAACDEARARGTTVLTARGGELERGLPYGVVRGLFETLVRGAPAAERNALLADAAGLAAPVLGVAGGQGGLIPDSAAFAGLHGLYWLTANLAERAPLLLAVDDAHWADEASLRFLVYILRRTEALPILRAVDLAVQCHAAPLADRAGQELVAAGARPRRTSTGVDALTPSELRVARMAAEGMGNRAIAQALFVTIKTIEVHLGSAYRKLGLRSRAALADALAGDRQPARAPEASPLPTR